MRSFFVVGLLFVSSQCWAGAWTQPRYGHYAKLSYLLTYSNEIQGGTSAFDYERHALYFYFEFGLHERLTFILSGPIFQHAQRETNAIRGVTRGGFAGDIESRLRFALFQRNSILSLEAGIKSPAGYDTTHEPPLGNGYVDANFFLLLGRSLQSIHGYWNLTAGYRTRGGDFVDELYAAAELGFRIREPWSLRVMSDGIRSLGSAGGRSNLFGFPLDQESFRISGGLIYQLAGSWELELGLQQLVAGEHVLRAQDWILAIAHKS